MSPIGAQPTAMGGTSSDDLPNVRRFKSSLLTCALNPPCVNAGNRSGELSHNFGVEQIDQCRFIGNPGDIHDHVVDPDLRQLFDLLGHILRCADQESAGEFVEWDSLPHPL